MHTLAEIAVWLNGDVIGDPNTPITSVAPLEEAGPGAITWAEDARRVKAAAAGRAGAVIVGRGTEPFGRPLVLVDYPRLAFAQVLALFAPPDPQPSGIDPSARVHPEAQLGERVCVGPLASIAAGARIGAGTRLGAGVHIGADTELGRDCLVHPGVIVRDRVRIGDRVILQAGAVIGADGFGYVPADGAHHKVPHIGTVIVEDDVEVGANTTIDRGTCGATVIGKGTKIDNLVQIGHNVKIGEHCLVVALTGLAGSSSLGRRVTLAGQSGVAGHIHVGDGSLVYARGLVAADLPAGAQVSGAPARPHGDALRQLAALARVPKLLSQIEALKAQVAALETAVKAVNTEAGTGGSP